MEIFKLTLSQMLMLFAIILVGFFLSKKKLIPDNADKVMSRLETCVFVPALVLSNQISKCTPENFAKNWTLILYGFALVLGSIMLSYPLSRLFVKKGGGSVQEYQRNIYKYALTFGNYGFVGNFIVQGIWGDDAFFKYLLLTFGVGVCCYVWGLYILVPKDKNCSLLSNLKNGLLKPPMIATFAGIALGLLGGGEFLPDFLLTALKNCGSCQGPVAMLLAGFVIGGYNLRELVSNKKVYGVSLMRLVVIPAVMMLVLYTLGTNVETMTLALITFATPLGLNTIVFPAAYGGDTKTGASMAMVSHTLSVITIPLMYLVFIEFLPKI